MTSGKPDSEKGMDNQPAIMAAPAGPAVAAPSTAVPALVSETANTAQGSMHIPVNGRQKTDVSGYETVLVDGELEGTVANVEWFSLARDGRFTGDADVVYADLSGEVDGNINCRQKLIVRSTARVTGKLSACVLEVHPGALISGTVDSYGPRPQASTPGNPSAGDDKSSRWRGRLSLWSFVLLTIVSAESVAGLF